uniref:Uncharacterized protein n=1 Tax=Vombatus ursinus TaxID=29139 RepID=A0A4X2LQN3_VOMUR
MVHPDQGNPKQRENQKSRSSSSILTPPNIPGYCTQCKDLGKLYKAASVGGLEKVQHHLQYKKHDLDKRDKEHRTPLHLACANEYLDVVSLLVVKKSKLNIWDNENKSPLIKQEQCTTILLENTAESSLMDIKKNTAIHHGACGRNVPSVNKLIEHKANIEAQNKDGHTPLSLVITKNSPEMVTNLLKKGTDMNVSDNHLSYSRMALMLAVGGELIGIVNLLLQQDIYGLTAEKYAICSGYSMLMIFTHTQFRKKGSKLQ